MNAVMKSDRENLFWLAVLLGFALLAAFVLALDFFRRPARPSRIDWPAPASRQP